MKDYMIVIIWGKYVGMGIWGGTEIQDPIELYYKIQNLKIQ